MAGWPALLGGALDSWVVGDSWLAGSERTRLALVLSAEWLNTLGVASYLLRLRLGARARFIRGGDVLRCLLARSVLASFLQLVLIGV